MTFSSFGGCGGPEMCDVPEIVELLCGCGGVCVWMVLKRVILHQC